MYEYSLNLQLLCSFLGDYNIYSPLCNDYNNDDDDNNNNNNNSNTKTKAKKIKKIKDKRKQNKP